MEQALPGGAADARFFLAVGSFTAGRFPALRLDRESYEVNHARRESIPEVSVLRRLLCEILVQVRGRLNQRGYAREQIMYNNVRIVACRNTVRDDRWELSVERVQE